MVTQGEAGSFGTWGGAGQSGAEWGRAGQSRSCLWQQAQPQAQEQAQAQAQGLAQKRSDQDGQGATKQSGSQLPGCWLM